MASLTSAWAGPRHIRRNMHTPKAGHVVAGFPGLSYSLRLCGEKVARSLSCGDDFLAGTPEARPVDLKGLGLK